VPLQYGGREKVDEIVRDDVKASDDLVGLLMNPVNESS
jgi:hypothetical protein